MSNPVLDIEVDLRGGVFSMCRQIGQFETTTGTTVDMKILENGSLSSRFMRLQLTFADTGLAALFKLGYTPDALNPCAVSNGQ